MLYYPNIDPIAFHIWHFPVHWYGLMYLFGFGCAWFLGMRRAALAGSGWQKEEVADLIFYAAIGVVLGGRIGYTLFYNFSYSLAHPLTIFKIWQGGMSFHGGLLGVIVSCYWFARRYQKGFWQITDFVVPLVPLGLAAGRIGNFINGELWGRVTTMPWGMVFPNAGPLPRHPSQLYECALEGIVLFLILWFFSAKPKPKMAVSGLFLLAYGCFRIVLEFFRQPDAQLGFVAWGWLSQGQLLSIPMVGLGMVLLVLAYRRNQ